MRTKTFTAILHKEEDLYVAECPEVGTVSQGHTIKKAITNLKESTELYLEEFPLPNIDRSILLHLRSLMSKLKRVSAKTQKQKN